MYPVGIDWDISAFVYVIGARDFTSLKKFNYPNECLGVNIGHKVVIIIHVSDLWSYPL